MIWTMLSGLWRRSGVAGIKSMNGDDDFKGEGKYS